MAFNPMDMFEAGNQIGKSRKSPAAYGADNLMDQFNFNRQLGAQAGVQGALEDYKQQLATKYEPMRKKQELETQYGLESNMYNNMINKFNGSGGDSSSSNDASKPAQVGALDSKKTNALQSASMKPMMKSMKIGPFEIGNPNYDASVAQAKIPIEAQAEGAKKGASDLQTLENLKDQSLNIISNGIGNFKQMNQNNPLANAIGPGRVAGGLNVFGRITGTNPGAAPYGSSKIEIATELAKIANPSGRPGPDMINMYQKLLPDDFSNEQEASNKFANAIHNALARYHGAKQAVEAQQGLEPTPYSRSEYDPQVQSILQSPASKQLSMDNTPQSRLESKLKQRGWI